MRAPSQIEGRPLRADGSAWHVLHTKSRQEKAVAEFLAAAGIDHFLPLVRRARYYGRRKVVADLPLFPGYVFLRGTRDEAFAVDRTDRVARIIPVIDQGTLAAELANLREALERGAPLDHGRFIERGVRVEVAAGPFRGIQGIVEHPIGDDRISLQVTLLGRAAELQIERSLLAPAA